MTFRNRSTMITNKKGRRISKNKCGRVKLCLNYAAVPRNLMAAPQLFPPCAQTGLLLLLIGVISANLPEVHTKPVDFWCRGGPKEKTMDKINNMAQTNCTGVDVLPSPVQLPCTGINTEWRNKPVQQKNVDVLEALQVFQHGVKHVKNETSLQCQSSLLVELEQSITYLEKIVSQANEQGSESTSPHPSGKICGSASSFNEVVGRYKLLLKGKLHHLAVDLCSAMTQDNKGKSS